MNGRFLLVASMFLTAGLAGCTDDDAFVPDEAVNVVTDPNDAVYDPDDVREHKHDYWNGRDRIEFMNVEGRGFGFDLGGGSSTCTTLYPEDGFFVPQGTATMEFEVRHNPGPTHMADGMELRVKTAAMTDPVYVGDIGTSMTSLSMDVTLEDADLPHQVLSAWEIQVCATGEPLVQFRRVSTTIDLTAEAVNGLEIPLFPPHPDFWDGSNITERPLLDEANGNTAFWQNSPPGCNGYCSGGLGNVDMGEGNIVPPDATVVLVEMTYSADTPTTVALMYHGSKNREWVPAPEVSDDGTVKIYEIPVDNNGDGPYAEQSLWQFNFQFEDGDGPYRGQWSLSAKVVKE